MIKLPEDLMPEYIVGNVIDVLKKMPENSINCVVTSPPYWGLRDYGIPPVIWGGKPRCKHEFTEEVKKGKTGGECKLEGAGKQMTEARYLEDTEHGFCKKCGAWRGQLGLEPTPQLYIDHLVMIFNEVKRVLRPDGVLWLNLGDSYAGSGGIDGVPDDWDSISTSNRQKYSKKKPNKKTSEIGLKPKDLIGIPWMAAFALRDRGGWYLRSGVVWEKPNPMPESVKDRPTNCHEFIFELTKSNKYYYDYIAIQEDSVDPESFTGRRPRSAGQMDGVDPDNYKFHGSVQEDGSLTSGQLYPKKNKRSVWRMTTKPYPEAHFAFFPPELPETCILAGTPVKTCGICGEPWKRILKKSKVYDHVTTAPGKHKEDSPYSSMIGDGEGTHDIRHGVATITQTIGWKATCEHDDDTGKAIVLDPFAGSGTTLQVARELCRRSIGIDIGENYRELALKRDAFKMPQKDLFSYGQG